MHNVGGEIRAAYCVKLGYVMRPLNPLSGYIILMLPVVKKLSK